MTVTDQPATTKTDEDEPKPFALFISETARGRTHRTLTRALHQLIADVQEIGAVGTLTLKIGIKPMDGDGEQIQVVEDVIVTAPRQPSKSIYFVDGHGNPSRTDPRQMEFGIDMSTGEVR